MRRRRSDRFAGAACAANRFSARRTNALKLFHAEPLVQITGDYSAPIRALARVLYEKMEHLDPGFCGGDRWIEIEPHYREFFALAVESVLEQYPLVLDVLADNNVVARQADLRKELDED